MNLDTRPAEITERLADVGAVVAGGIAQRDDAAATDFHVHVAVGIHRKMAGRAQIFCHDGRAEALGQGDASVAGIAASGNYSGIGFGRRFLVCAGAIARGKRKEKEDGGADESRTHGSGKENGRGRGIFTPDAPQVST